MDKRFVDVVNVVLSCVMFSYRLLDEVIIVGLLYTCISDVNNV